MIQKSTQMNHGPKKAYRTAPGRDGPVKHAQSNFSGGSAKKAGGNASKQQTNFTGTVSIKDHSDPGQGQKHGTGSQGGY
jgi:hypothetical protein